MRCPLFLRLVSASCILIYSGTGLAADRPPPGFTLHAVVQGEGKILNALIAPGPEAGSHSEWIYASYINLVGTLDIIAINPSTGKSAVFASPLTTEHGAWAMVEGADKQVYIGTLPSAHIMRVDWKTHALVDLGAPSSHENYIWQLALGSDGKLYGGTAPHAKLVRFDPASGKSEDLGRMSQTEDYARYVAADNRGFVYIGIGMVKGDLVAYDIATGEHRTILPAGQDLKGTITVVRGADGRVYARLDHWVQLSGWKTTPSLEPPIKPLDLSNGQRVSFIGSDLFSREPDGKIANHFATSYERRPQEIFHIAKGSDGRLYGSTSMPIQFFWADPSSAAQGDIGEAGQGEFYSMLTWHDRVLAAAYAATAPIISYNPKRTWAPGNSENNNPWWIHYSGENESWRPLAMINGPQDKVYIGALPGYGELGGPLCVLDPATGKVAQYRNVVADQSVIALAALPSGMIAGGTTIQGGSGSHPTQKNAKLFLWDPKTRKKVFETIPVNGQGTIDALAVGHNGMVYGFAGSTMFVFNPATRKIIGTTPTNMSDVIPNALGSGPRGVLYGLTHMAIFTIDERTNRPLILASYPGGIDRGFAISGSNLYFAQGAQLVSYQLPN